MRETKRSAARKLLTQSPQNAAAGFERGEMRIGSRSALKTQNCIWQKAR